MDSREPEKERLSGGDRIKKLPALARRLLLWYDGNARTLPWRDEPTPYRVWVSEIMLQQTRVETVIPYFERFVAALPDVKALADAPEEALMKLWEGLGYYSRARNLQRAARVVTERFGGELPASVELLRSLPGVGDYTAGAVASIAFNLPAAAVDGNVLRVMSRLLGSERDVALPETKRFFTKLVPEMQPHDRPGDFSQALMELGAMVCVPGRAPRCGSCPLAGDCAANAGGIAGELPVKEPKKARRIERRTAFLVLWEDRVLLRRRPSEGLLAGLWELPHVPGWLDEGQGAETVGSWGGTDATLSPLKDKTHVFTHLEWHLRVFLARTEGFEPPDGMVWVPGKALSEEYALAGAFSSIVRPYL